MKHKSMRVAWSDYCAGKLADCIVGHRASVHFRRDRLTLAGRLRSIQVAGRSRLRIHLVFWRWRTVRFWSFVSRSFCRLSGYFISHFFVFVHYLKTHYFQSVFPLQSEPAATAPSLTQSRFGIIRSNQIKDYIIVRPKVDQRAGQLCLPHIGITKTEKNTIKT